MAIHGFMLDPARLVERREVYDDLLGYAAGWGYNTLFWHFSDDSRCAIRFDSHPELAGQYAFTADETRRFIERAASVGIQVIPELECLGHTGYITRNPRYAHLRDGVAGKEFGAVAPLHPETRRLLADLIAETCQLFPAPYLHVGLDETAFGDNPDTAEHLRGRKKWELFAEHIRWLREQAVRHGKTLMIWGDHLLPQPVNNMATHLDSDAISEAIADAIPKDVIICDWHYEGDVKADSLEYFLQKGFRVLACPATSSYGMIAHPARWNLDNVVRFSRYARERLEPDLLGVINAVWCSQRCFLGTILYGLALGGVAQHGEPGPEFAGRFLHETFGLSESDQETANAIATLHDVSPRFPLFKKICPVNPSEIQPFSETEQKLLQQIAAGAKEAFEVLTARLPRVTRRRGDFEEIIFTARALAELAARKLSPEEAARLYQDAVVLWARTRHEDDPERDGLRNGGCGVFVQRLCHHAGLVAELDSIR